MIGYIMLSINKFSGSNLADYICVFILVSAVYWFLRYDLRELFRLVKTIVKINGVLNTVDKIYTDKLGKINRIVDGKIHPAIKRIWLDYFYALERSAITDTNPDCKDYFSLNAAIGIPACRKKVEAIPGMLAGMGVMGAVLNFAVVIRGIKTGAEIWVQENAVALQKGLTTALGIVVASTATAIIFQILDRRLYHQAEKELDAFQSLLERKIIKHKSYRSQEYIVEVMRQQADSLKDMGEAIGAELRGLVNNSIIPELHSSLEKSIMGVINPFTLNMSQLVHQMSEFVKQHNVEAIQGMTDCFINQLNESTDGQLKKFGTSIQQLCESQGKAKEDLDLLIIDLLKNTENQREINRTSQSIIENVALYYQEILSSSSELNGSMEKVKLLADSLSNVVDMAGNAIDKFCEQRMNLQKENEVLFESIGEQAVKMREDFNSETERVIERFTGITASTLNRLENELGAAFDRLTGNAGQVLDSMEIHAKSIGLSSKVMAERVGELNGRLESSVKEFYSQVHTGIGETFTDFDKALGKACSRLSNTITEIADSVDELPMVIEAFKDKAASA